MVLRVNNGTRGNILSSRYFFRAGRILFLSKSQFSQANEIIEANIFQNNH